LCGGRVNHDGLAITIEGIEDLSVIERAVGEIAARDPSSMAPSVEEEAIEGLKFSKCLPTDLALATLVSRLRDQPAVNVVLSKPVRVVSGL
jgi:ATP-dependent Lhr-like helicase